MTMNDLALKTIAARGLPRSGKDVWRNDLFVVRLRNFIALEPSDLADLRDVVETEVAVKKRRDLVLDGYHFNKLGFITQGFAARYKLLRNGKRQIINFLLPGDVIGIPGSFLDRAANSVVAVSDMRLKICPLEAFVALCCRRPKFALALSWLMAQEAAIYAEHIVNIGRRKPIERLAHLLLEIHARLVAVDHAGQTAFDMPFTQEMLSDALGLSVPHLNRTLAQLRVEGILAVNERRIEFRDTNALARLAQFQPINPGRIPVCGSD